MQQTLRIMDADMPDGVIENGLRGRNRRLGGPVQAQMQAIHLIAESRLPQETRRRLQGVGQRDAEFWMMPEAVLSPEPLDGDAGTLAKRLFEALDQFLAAQSRVWAAAGSYPLQTLQGVVHPPRRRRRGPQDERHPCCQGWQPPAETGPNQ